VNVALNNILTCVGTDAYLKVRGKKRWCCYQSTWI